MLEYSVRHRIHLEDLDTFLNNAAADGWRFIQHVSTEGYIFERVVKEVKQPATRRRKSKVKPINNHDTNE